MRAVPTILIPLLVLALALGQAVAAEPVVLVADDEPGTPLLIQGRVLEADGATPVPGSTVS